VQLLEFHPVVQGVDGLQMVELPHVNQGVELGHIERIGRNQQIIENGQHINVIVYDPIHHLVDLPAPPIDLEVEYAKLKAKFAIIPTAETHEYLVKNGLQLDQHVQVERLLSQDLWEDKEIIEAEEFVEQRLVARRESIDRQDSEDFI
jgi:hypothetical protein